MLLFLPLIFMQLTSLNTEKEIKAVIAGGPWACPELASFIKCWSRPTQVQNEIRSILSHRTHAAGLKSLHTKIFLHSSEVLLKMKSRGG